jgi:hypothetical protein
VSDIFPLGGITESFGVPRDQADAVISKLTSCGHTHVFIVDQSGMIGPPEYTRFGVSESGLRCAQQVLAET